MNDGTDLNMQDKIEKLKQLISRSKEERGAFSRNGYGFAIVSSEKYDAIPKEDLTILEKEYSVSLPDEYKAFVTEIAMRSAPKESRMHGLTSPCILCADYLPYRILWHSIA